MDGMTSVDAYLKTLDDPTRADADALAAMMQRISGRAAELHNGTTLGYGSYHYKYASGREGDAFVIGFYPRKNKTTVYVMDGTSRYADLLAKLGTHTITGYCLYIKRLADVDVAVLEQLLGRSWANIEAKSKQGPIREILWKSAD